MILFISYCEEEEEEGAVLFHSYSHIRRLLVNIGKIGTIMMIKGNSLGNVLH